MEFVSTEEAWNFWVRYAGRIGFNVKKSYHNRSTLDGKIISRAYVCGNKGFHSKDKWDCQTRYPRQEIRTGCRVRLVLKLDRKSRKYEVTEFISEHNYILQLPQAFYLLPCQRKVSVFLYNSDFVKKNNNKDNKKPHVYPKNASYL